MQLSFPRLSCRCAMNRAGLVLEPGRASCLKSLTTLYRVSTYAIRWVRGPVSSFMCSWHRAMGRQSSSLAKPGTLVLRQMWRLANAPLGDVDEEPLDWCQKALDEAAPHMVQTGSFAVGLVQRGLQVSHGVLLDLGQRALRDLWRPRTALELRRSTGRVPYSLYQKAQNAAITLWASVRSVWVLGTLTFHRPDGPGASTLMACEQPPSVGGCPGRCSATSP